MMNLPHLDASPRLVSGMTQKTYFLSCPVLHHLGWMAIVLRIMNAIQSSRGQFSY